MARKSSNRSGQKHRLAVVQIPDAEKSPGAVKKRAERKRDAGDHFMLFSSQEFDSFRNMIAPPGPPPQGCSLTFEGLSYFRRTFSEHM